MIHRHVMALAAALIISAGAALADDDVKVAANCVGSMVATIGAGDFTSVQPGQTAQERVVELYVTAAKAAEFTAFVGK